MKIFSSAFHTSYQYNLASAFPEHEWTFLGPWSQNRPECGNVVTDRAGDLADYDFFLAHSPAEYISLAGKLDVRGISRSRLVYISHWGYQPHQWVHVYNGVNFDYFINDVSGSPIVCVSHYMVPQFGFYSEQSVSVIPHFIPSDLFGECAWRDEGEEFINVVNSFYQPERGVGAAFWDSLPVAKKLYGGGNKPTDGGELHTIDDFKSAVSRSRAYLWTADAVATSFAPLEAMALGCPLVAPDNLDWRKEFEHGREVLLYKAGDIDSCLEQVNLLNNSSSMRSSLSIAGREAVLSRFTKELFRQRWKQVFDGVLSTDLIRPKKSGFSMRRGSGVMLRDDGTFDLATEICLKAGSLCVVHPQSDESEIRLSLRNKSNSVDLLEGFACLAARGNLSRHAVTMADDFGSTTQAVIKSGRSVCVYNDKYFSEFERKTNEFNRDVYPIYYVSSVDFIEDPALEALGGGASGPIFCDEQFPDGDFSLFISYDGREPALIKNMFERGVFPSEIVANCMPDASWAMGCHVEVLVEALVQNEYAVQFLSIPELEDISALIAPGDTIPKLHRYILRAVRV
ncbi:glycosyltransferase [Brevundimonas sp. SORGH_AS_0993]|uniref:glycosyltransferase family protein n=1 Tax=Brevundimonas sp. SORGH_AS_0993 TaxID=3041794 RepID=UPI00278536F4|nr:glycosyltransferase [Brevundimonas sp. SORGH_AS_0993]MDQ1154776.1 glycosyltransferase involved in cell wall biosynthesis [Brevundimonas sp. SORGH_AS_0993]